jgi:hypothetical protein
MTTFRRTLRSDDPLAIKLTTTLKEGEAVRTIWRRHGVKPWPPD